jgi:hypothetical protein
MPLVSDSGTVRKITGRFTLTFNRKSNVWVKRRHYKQRTEIYVYFEVNMVAAYGKHDTKISRCS